MLLSSSVRQSVVAPNAPAQAIVLPPVPATPPTKALSPTHRHSSSLSFDSPPLETVPVTPIGPAVTPPSNTTAGPTSQTLGPSVTPIASDLPHTPPPSSAASAITHFTPSEADKQKEREINTLDVSLPSAPLFESPPPDTSEPATSLAATVVFGSASAPATAVRDQADSQRLETRMMAHSERQQLLLTQAQAGNTTVTSEDALRGGLDDNHKHSAHYHSLGHAISTQPHHHRPEHESPRITVRLPSNHRVSSQGFFLCVVMTVGWKRNRAAAAFNTVHARSTSRGFA
jgi:hypothetical protein